MMALNHRRIHCMTVLIFLWAVCLFAAEIPGIVTAVSGSSITIKTNSSLLPAIGDLVDISFTTPGGEIIPVGVWRVSLVDGQNIEAIMVESSGDPNIDMNAVIHSENPRTQDEARGQFPQKDGSRKMVASLNATFSNLRFYESKTDDIVPSSQRLYRNSFDSSSGFIWWEFTLDYTTSRRIDFGVVSKYYDPDGNFLSDVKFDYYLDPVETQVYYTAGYRLNNGWPPGDYRVDIYIDGQKVDSASFRVTTSKAESGCSGVCAQTSPQKFPT